MSDSTFAPPLTALDDVDAQLAAQGMCVLCAQSVRALCQASATGLEALGSSWQDLEPDTYLRDGGRYRRRRHASFVVEGRVLTQVPHRAHYQPLDYNALHGGFERWFAPMQPADAQNPAFQCLVTGLAALCSRHLHTVRWHVEAHQFRIDTADGIGRPTPEGAHRDGVDFVAVLLVARHNVIGGETRVFAVDGPHGQRFTLVEPWSLLFMDDARVMHESTPIRPAHAGVAGYRDTLVLTFRRDGFLSA